MTDASHDARTRLLEAILVHVPFDGWTEASFRMAVADAGLDPALARAICPRGAVDLALDYHARGDQAMLERLRNSDLSAMRFRDRIAAAVRYRLEVIEDKEVVRRAATLFALPHHAADGSRAVWETCDLIWTTLGDTSEDVNWYTKRATLSAVYSATLLYWLGDNSDGHEATWEFLDRRIDDVMRFEKLKAGLRDNAALKPLLAVPNWFLGQIKAPSKRRGDDLPGRMDPRG